MKLSVRLKNNKKPVSITLLRSESVKMTAHNYMVIDLKENKAYFHSVFTNVLVKFNTRGYFFVDKKVINRLKESPRLTCVEMP